MSRPKDIPEDILDVAEKLFFESAPNSTGVVEAIARAIMAAKVEERAAILEIVETAPLSNRPSDPAVANKLMADWIVRAIRKRGDVNTVHSKKIVEG